MKKIFSIALMALAAMTASAYDLTIGTNDHGTVTFYVDGVTATTADEGDEVTVVITPDDGWVVNEPSGQWYAAQANAPRRAAISILSDIEMTTVDGEENQWTFTMQRATAEISVSYKKLMTHTDITISDFPDVTYNGSAFEPAVTVLDGSDALTLDTDYNVTYSNNTNAGTATVTVTGIGDNYAGTAAKTFTILQATGTIAFADKWIDMTYGDTNFINTLTIVGDGTVTYTISDGSVASVDAATGVVTIIGTGYAKVTATVADGANYAYAVTSAFYEFFVAAKPVSNEGGTSIAVNENGYVVTIDENSSKTITEQGVISGDLLDASGSIYVAEVNYSRELDAPKTKDGDVTIDGSKACLYTVCLPFAPKTAGNVKYYTLSAASGSTLTFAEVANPVAHTPYVVAVTGSKDLNESSYSYYVTLRKDVNNSTAKDGFVLKGTETGLTNADAASAGAYILQPGNKWGLVTTENTAAYIPPFRAYIVATSPSAAPQLSNSFGGEGTTAIENIRTVDQDGTERWFDLSGREVSAPKKGLYIRGGKKVIK